MITVWGRKNSINVQKAMWTIGELGLAHERHDVGGQFRGNDTPDYLAMNPNGLVPTVRDGDLVLWESNAIVRYLAAKHSAGRLWPAAPEERALADRWMDWQATTLHRDMTVVFWGLIRTVPEERDMRAITASTQELGRLWSILDAHLATRSYVGGDDFTMGDIPPGAACYRYLHLPIERPHLPHLESWYGRLQQRPAFREHVMVPLT